ncbi:hypothetical protein [Rhodococcus jostii]|nr:hypothetical protein [Rhodococcus jostii]
MAVALTAHAPIVQVTYRPVSLLSGVEDHARVEKLAGIAATKAKD